MQGAVDGITRLIVQQRRLDPDSLGQPTSVHDARAFVLSVDELLRPRPVLCSWFAEACLEHAANLTDHIRFLAVAVVLSSAAELPRGTLNAVERLLPDGDPPPRDILSMLHWKCIVCVAGVVCLKHPTHQSTFLSALCDHASHIALASSVSETINSTSHAHRIPSSILRPPCPAVFHWACLLIVHIENSAQQFAWLHRHSSSNADSRALHDHDAPRASLPAHAQPSTRASIPSPLLFLHDASVGESQGAAGEVHADITSALRCAHNSLSAVAVSHRTACTMQQFLNTLCDCLNTEAQNTPSFDISPYLHSITDLLHLAHDTLSSECPMLTLPLARFLAARCASNFDVWLCVHACMLGPAASGCMEVTAADVGAVLDPPAPLARLTHVPGPVDAGVHACWAFACACMQQQLHADLYLLPSTLICLARACDAAAVAAALLCRAGQWLCMCSGPGTAHDDALSRCIDVAMTVLQTLTSLACTPSMTFLSRVHDAWRSAVATACEHDDAVLDCVPPYLSLFSLAASRAVFCNVYGPNISTDVNALVASALSSVPRLRQLLPAWMNRCGIDSSHALCAVLRDAGVLLSSSVLQVESIASRDHPTRKSLFTTDITCPQTPPRPDRPVVSPLAYRLAQYQSPSQKSPAASPLHKSTEAVLDRVLLRFSDDPSSLPIDAAKFSQQVKSLESWRLMVAAVAAPQSSSWAATNLKTRCRFVHALVSSSLPGAEAAVPHLAAWVVGADRRMDGDVLHSIVTTWARSSMLLDCSAFCLWALRQAQASPGVLTSFQSLHTAITIMQPMLHPPSVMSALAAELSSTSIPVCAAARMLALVFASGYSLDAVHLHRIQLSFGFSDESQKMVGGNGAAAALSIDPFGYLCMHGVAGAALVLLHEDDAVASLLRGRMPETLRIVTHRICFHVLRCLSMTAQILNRCNVRVLLSLAAAISRDLPQDAELPENAAAAERLLKLCSVLHPAQVAYGEEAVQLLLHSRCDLLRSSIENACSSFFSDAAAGASARGMLSSAWDASWLASVIAACGHRWDVAAAERALWLLGLQLQFGCEPDVGICASLPESIMLRSATSLMQQQQQKKQQQHPHVMEHIAKIALQLFCRRASVAAGAPSVSSADGLEISASLALLCEGCGSRHGIEQLSLLLCMVTCSLMQQLQRDQLDPCSTLTNFFDEHCSAMGWRGLCHAHSRSNLALAAAAGFSSGAVAVSQLLRVGAQFTSVLTLVQAAPSHAFAAFSPLIQSESEQNGSTSSALQGVKVERHQQKDTNTDADAHPTPHPSAAAYPAATAHLAESSGTTRCAAAPSLQAKRQLDMRLPAEHSCPSPRDAEQSGRRVAQTASAEQRGAVTSQLPKKRIEQSPSPASKQQLALAHDSSTGTRASADAIASRPLSWLAQLRAHAAAGHPVDDTDGVTRVHGVTCEPVQGASPAALRMASAAADAGVAAFALQDGIRDHSKAEGGSDDDIVALS